ncbi:MAG: alpha-amylase family protein [Gemmatimonadota bacterium]|nr:alpha-amylase family protein [Gemmatimonadota bacterium]
MFDLKLRSTLLFACLVILGVMFMPVGSGAADFSKKPRWWLEDGICFVGNWEPLVFRLRRGGRSTDYMADYEAQHSVKTIRALKKAGVNMMLTHFYKGMGPDLEEWDLAYTRKLCQRARAEGLRVGAYIGSTLFSETLYNEVPDSRNWTQLDNRGRPIIYSDQYFRERADFTTSGYRELIKSQITKAITEYGMDLIHFDNFYTMFPLEAGFTEHIQELFREYLRRKYTPDQLWERLGFRDVSLVRPPRLASTPMSPVQDPLAQEWIEFRVETLADFIRELAGHIRTLNPQTVIEFNPHGLWGENNAYNSGMDHARLLPLCDIFWSEDPDHAHYFPDQNRLVSKIRSYKLARHFGTALFSYNHSPLELAEAMAFNRMCPGNVSYSVVDKQEDKRYIKFFHRNKELFRDLEVLADVGVLRDFASLTYGGWDPYLATVQAEQVLIQDRVPFDLLFEQDWQRLEQYPVVVAAAQENLSDEKVLLLKRYVESGGALVVVGRTGAFDERRRVRTEKDNFWKLMGLGASPAMSGKAARLESGQGKVFFLPLFENHPSVPGTADNVHPDYWYLPLNHEEFLMGLRWCRGGDFSVNIETKPHLAAAHYRKGQSRQVHLVNYWPGHPVRQIPVIFSSEEKSPSPSRARLYCPETDKPQELELSRYGQDCWSVIVPRIDIYGLLVVE